jgi:hypothetical protein
MCQIAVRRRENPFPLGYVLQNLSKKLAIFLFAFMYASTEVQYFMAGSIIPKRSYLYIREPRGRREIGRLNVHGKTSLEILNIINPCNSISLSL